MQNERILLSILQANRSLEEVFALIVEHANQANPNAVVSIDDLRKAAQKITTAQFALSQITTGINNA